MTQRAGPPGETGGDGHDYLHANERLHVHMRRAVANKVMVQNGTNFVLCHQGGEVRLHWPRPLGKATAAVFGR